MMRPLWTEWVGVILIMALIFGVLLAAVGLIVWAVTRRRAEPPRSPDRAMDVLRERYACGEITREEFEQMRRDLLGWPPLKTTPATASEQSPDDS